MAAKSMIEIKEILTHSCSLEVASSPFAFRIILFANKSVIPDLDIATANAPSIA